jgi:murein L,D-transpeptidase YcbB/YkuD
MKKPDSLSGRPKLIDAVVSSPTVPGAIENVKRVVDTIEAMHRRRQLGASADRDLRLIENDRSYRAAIRLRHAHDVVTGSIGGVMDFDRVRSGGGYGSPPPLHYREAADDLIDMRAVLDSSEHPVISLIVCEGHSIDFATQWLHGHTARAAREDTGALMRRGLQKLADHWFEPGRIESKTKVRAYHAADADPRLMRYAANAGTVQRGQTVSATRNRIYRG